MTLTGLETALRLLKISADAVPPLKSAVGELVSCLAQVRLNDGFSTLYLVLLTLQSAAENHEEYEKLATELTNMLNMLAPYVPMLIAEDLGGSVGRIIE